MTAYDRSISTQNVQAPIIAGVEITTDAQGRFNLNALHRASGLGDHKAPNRWLRLDQAKSLIAELEVQTPDLASGVLSIANGGSAPGTFAAEELAISYAGWISPSFQLEVNRVFIAHRTGRTPVQAIPAEVLEQIDRTFGVVRMLAHKVTEMERTMPLIASELADRLVTERLAHSALLLRSGKTAKQIWDRAGLPRGIKGSTAWFGNRLKAGGCMMAGKADRGDGAIRLFDPDKAETLLELGLRQTALTYAAERKGQGKLKLVAREGR